MNLALFSWANGRLGHELANYSGSGSRDQFAELANVGSFPQNRLGLYDMAGNVAEYVFDICDANYYSISPAVNPAGPGPLVSLGRLDPSAATLMILRGGSWRDSQGFVRAASRATIEDIPQFVTLPAIAGFRVAK